MVAAYFAGELDPASAGISTLAGDMGCRHQFAHREHIGIQLFPGPARQGGYVLTMNEEVGLPSIMPIRSGGASGSLTSLFRRASAARSAQERDNAFLASLECTADRIAEQQAQLDAMRARRRHSSGK